MNQLQCWEPSSSEKQAKWECEYNSHGKSLECLPKDSDNNAWLSSARSQRDAGSQRDKCHTEVKVTQRCMDTQRLRSPIGEVDTKLQGHTEMKDRHT